MILSSRRLQINSVFKSGLKINSGLESLFLGSTERRHTDGIQQAGNWIIFVSLSDSNVQKHLKINKTFNSLEEGYHHIILCLLYLFLLKDSFLFSDSCFCFCFCFHFPVSVFSLFSFLFFFFSSLILFLAQRQLRILTHLPLLALLSRWLAGWTLLPSHSMWWWNKSKREEILFRNLSISFANSSQSEVIVWNRHRRTNLQYQKWYFVTF